MNRLKSIYCFLFGHNPDPYMGYFCTYCDKEFKDYLNYTEEWGKIGWHIHKVKQSFQLRWAVYRWRAIFPRCEQCNKLLLFRKRHRKDFCSEKCYNNYLPF